MSSKEVLLHLDYPVLAPPNSEFEVKGWIASDVPVVRVSLERVGETVRMALTERPDVRAAKPDFLHTTGFAGYGNVHFISSSQLAFRIVLADRELDFCVKLRNFVIKPINPIPDLPVDDAVKAEKFRKIADRLICPTCRSSVSRNDAACRLCGAKFGHSNSMMDFLQDAQMGGAGPSSSMPESKGGFDEIAYALVQRYKDGVILDCGSGWKDRTFDNIINLEIMAYPSTDVRASNEALPFANETFDAVFSFATLEHIRDPFAAGREIARVLKPGGIVYSIVPLISPYHGFPSHFYNMTLDGHRNIYSSSIDVIYSFVPLFGRPIHALTWILNSWLAGLPDEYRNEFLELSVRDLTEDPFSLLKKNYVRFLSAEANMELAANTAILGRKRDSDM